MINYSKIANNLGEKVAKGTAVVLKSRLQCPRGNPASSGWIFTIAMPLGIIALCVMIGGLCYCLYLSYKDRGRLREENAGLRDSMARITEQNVQLFTENMALRNENETAYLSHSTPARPHVPEIPRPSPALAIEFAGSDENAGPRRRTSPPTSVSSPQTYRQFVQGLGDKFEDQSNDEI